MIALPFNEPHSEAPSSLLLLPRDTPKYSKTAFWGNKTSADFVQELRTRVSAHKHLKVQWEAAGHKITDELLWRWLVAKGGSVAIAEHGFLQHMRWRLELGPIDEASIRKELDAEKVFLQGCDNHGRPVIIVLAARHVVKSRNLKETEKLITFTLETALSAPDHTSNPLGQILCLFDLSGLGLGNLDTKALKAVFAVLQQHFPESLSELWFLNAPFIFGGLWRVVSPFIQPATRNKIHFIGSLSRSFPEQDGTQKEVLPAKYGGNAALVQIEQAAHHMRHLRKEQAFGGSVRKPGETSADVQGRLLKMRRATVRMSMSSWNFARDHNPVWAGKLFGRGIKRVATAIYRPNRDEWAERHANILAEHVQRVWQKRGALPRPSYRFKRGSETAHIALLEVASFYFIIVRPAL